HPSARLRPYTTLLRAAIVQPFDVFFADLVSGRGISQSVGHAALQGTHEALHQLRIFSNGCFAADNAVRYHVNMVGHGDDVYIHRSEEHTSELQSRENR